MATLKEKKPVILPLKSDLVPVDLKKHKSGVWGNVLGYTRNTQPLRGLSVLCMICSVRMQYNYPFDQPVVQLINHTRMINRTTG